MRLINDYVVERGFGGRHNCCGLWGEAATEYGMQSAGAVATIIHTFRPSLVNEFLVGINRSFQITSFEDQAQYQSLLRPTLKGPDGRPVTLAKIFSNNPADLIPNIRLSTLNAQSAGQGITNAPAAGPQISDNRYPCVFRT